MYRLIPFSSLSLNPINSIRRFYRIQNRNCCLLLLPIGEGGRRTLEEWRDIILFNLIPLHPPPEILPPPPPCPNIHLKNTLCKIHVFYVLTCCICLQRDPFCLFRCDTAQSWGRNCVSKLKDIKKNGYRWTEEFTANSDPLASCAFIA